METSSPKLHMKTKTLECIKMLQAYKKMSDLPDNHNQLLKVSRAMHLRFMSYTFII